MVYTIVVHMVAKDDKVEQLKDLLHEASGVYQNDHETLSWFVMQDEFDSRKFCIVERYLNKDSQKYHLGNPYWKTFDPRCIPLLAQDMDLRRLEEFTPSPNPKEKEA